MADEAGSGADDGSNDIDGYTIASPGAAASVSGDVIALRFYGDSAGTYDVIFAFFTASGNDLTTVSGTRTTLEITSSSKAVQEWTSSGGDFTAFAVSSGNFIGLYTPTNVAQDYDQSGGSGMWYLSGDNTNVSGTTFSYNASYGDCIAADIQAASGTIVTIVMQMN